MKSRRQDVSEDRLITSRRDKRSKTSVNGRENSESMPIDLVIEILSRLPAKSIAKCRCVSKLWASSLRRPDFPELFLTRSRARPQLLFACHKREHNELFFLSSPQLQNLDENLSHVTAGYLMKIPCNYQYGKVWHINGLVFLRDERILKGRKKSAKVSVICNSSTGQSFVLSKSKTRKRNEIYTYLGYDPIEKQFKLLSITVTSSPEYQVQTLGIGTKKVPWRKVQCRMPYFPACKVICINGVLYFPEADMIVCFDIRCEKFCFMKVSNNSTTGTTLINYNGKLGLLVSDGPSFSGRSRSIVLWILEDTEKHEWSKHVYVLPPMWKNVVGNNSLDVVGVIGTNEFVFSSSSHSSSFYIFYYNIERNTTRRVEIQGLEAFKSNRVYTFLNHVENIKLVDGY